MTAPSLENTIESIEILHNLKPGNINDASNFLIELQQSNYAWSIADQLLYLNRDIVTSYFGAQTMRNKIQLHFEELPPESHLGLKESLMKHLSSIDYWSGGGAGKGTNSTVSTQLALALADLFCHMNQWRHGLPEIVSVFSRSIQSIPVLLDVLRYIPEELNNRSLRLGVNRKAEIFSELDRHRSMIVSVLERSIDALSSLQSSSSSQSIVSRMILDCFDSWYIISLFRDSDLVDSPLIRLTFEVLERPPRLSDHSNSISHGLHGDDGGALFASAARLAADLFSIDFQTLPELTKRLQLAVYRLDGVYRRCHDAATLSTTTHNNNNNLSTVASGYCVDYCKIFCEMAATLLPGVLDGPQFSGDGSPGDCRTLTMLLMTAETSRDCCALVIDVLIDVTESHNPRSCTTNERESGNNSTIDTRDDSDNNLHNKSGNNQHINNHNQTLLTPMFEELISIMTRHCAVSDREDEQTLCAFRSDVFFVMEQIRMFVDMESVFRKMLSSLSQLLTSPPPDGSNQAEAVLCIIGSLVKFVNTEAPENSAWIEQLLTQFILPSMQHARPSFRDVAFTMFGELCRWVARREHMMDCMLAEMARFITETNFDSADDLQISAFSSAVQSLAIFCKRQSPHILKSHRWDLIIRICQRFPELGFVNKELVGFYEALGRCLCIPGSLNHLKELNQTPEEMAHKLWQVCQINVEIVNQLVAKNKLCRTPRDPCDPCVWIDNVSGLFVSMPRMVSGGNNGGNKSRLLNSDDASGSLLISKQPYLLTYYSVMEQYLWPVLSGLIDGFLNDGRVLERVVRILRYSLRSFQKLSKQLLGNIAEKIVSAYSQSKESCFLYVGGILVDEFGDDVDCKQGLIQMFHAFSGPALSVLQDNGLDENPNTTEDLFRLMVRLVQRCSPDFLAWESLQINQLFSMAIRSIPGTNIDAKTLALRFLVEAFNCATVSKASGAEESVRESVRERERVVRERTVHWLANEGGLEHLWEAMLFLCRWKSEEVTGSDLVEDMSDLLVSVRSLVAVVGAEAAPLVTQHHIFIAALDHALSNIGVSRRDGMLYATHEQIQLFRSSMLQQDSQLLEGLETFAKLFS